MRSSVDADRLLPARGTCGRRAGMWTLSARDWPASRCLPQFGWHDLDVEHLVSPEDAEPEWPADRI